ncbi:MAG: PorV/PorQ family protein [Elusimicrobia bacterium]|nr:PorV/PorQ family protein [Elusimicrobiota bacterium]
MGQRAKVAVFSALFLCLGGSLPVRAGSFAGKGEGTTSADFLRLPVGARPSGMAEAFTGVADDVHALAYNPAGIAFLARQELGLVHDSYAPGINHEWLGYVHPLRFGTYGLAMNVFLVDPFDSYSQFDTFENQTSAMDAALQFSYGLRISDSWAVGGSGKYITSRLNTTKASTVAGDLGTLWAPTRGVRLGASVFHLGNGLRYVSETSPLPITTRLGASWTPYDPRDFMHYFTLALDGVQVQGHGVQVSGAIELWYQGIMALRLGSRSDAGAGTGYTGGVGLYVFRDPHRPCEVGFDYSFTDAGDFAQTHRASVVLKFGQTLREERRGTVIEWRRARDQAAPVRQREERKREREKERARLAPQSSAPEPEKYQPVKESEMILSPDYKKWVRP